MLIYLLTQFVNARRINNRLIVLFIITIVGNGIKYPLMVNTIVRELEAWINRGNKGYRAQE